jgi:hypothetical protein
VAAHLKVYVSSTYEDLKEYRTAVLASLRKMGMTPVCMEDLTAAGQTPLDKCLDDVRRSHAYVGIIAWRYGFKPPGYEQSITELEYQEAKKKGIPTHLFLLQEQAEWPDALRDTGTEGERIRKFREELKLKELVAFFPPSPYALANEVQSAIHHYIHKHNTKFKIIAIASLMTLILLFSIYFWRTSINQELTCLNGDVTAEDGTPIVGAVVELDRLPGQPKQTATDGDFTFAKVPGKERDPVTITVRAPGYRTEIINGVLASPYQIQLKREAKK